MKSKLFYVVAGLALAGAVSAQIAPPPAPPPIDGGAVPLLAQIRFQNDLSFGMEGGEVFELQYVLQAQGYLPADHVPTNYFGIKTRSAVMAYQRAKNLPATGFVGPLTRAALNGEAPGSSQETAITANMGIGSSSGQVRLLQNKLLALGYFSGEATGYFGVKTRAAVIAFQQAKGISATGYVGPLTRAALNAS